MSVKVGVEKHGEAWRFFRAPGRRADAASTETAGSDVIARRGMEVGGSATLNDLHSGLNATRVERVVRPRSIEALQAVVDEARGEGRAISIAGGRHAMGGQQFGADTVFLDTSSLDSTLALDGDRGLVEVEAGISWPQLLDDLMRAQQGDRRQWAFRQKQTGADRFCIGGALSANVHGRGLRLKPFIDDVESFTLIDANGRLRRCSRRENADLFRLAIGGYGLFGVIATVTLRLTRRRRVERVVRVIDLEDLVPAVERRIADGFLYGDFQFSIDTNSRDFLRNGVFCCYRPLDDDAEMPGPEKHLRARDWLRLLHLAHTDKRRAYQEYALHYLSTDGQRYWSDTQQLNEYVDHYHRRLDRKLGPAGHGTEMITELYVPRESLVAFLEDVASDLRAARADVIYGTVRFIERDTESFLAWAREPYACIVLNLHTAHTPAALEKTRADFRRLIDRAIEHRGSYYLTYHRWATREQMETCYPQFLQFLKLKRAHDPEERFQSEWYRHHRNIFADSL